MQGRAMNWMQVEQNLKSDDRAVLPIGCVEQHASRRVLAVNGHGGNAPAQACVAEWLASHPHMRVRWHNGWNAPAVWNQVVEIDPVASHASWMENLPWTRLEGVVMPRALLEAGWD